MRRMGLMSIRASALMVVFGVALLFVVPRPAAGLLCMWCSVSPCCLSSLGPPQVSCAWPSEPPAF